MAKSDLTMQIEWYLLMQRKMGTLVCQEVMVNRPEVYSGGSAKFVDVLRWQKATDDFTNYEIIIRITM